jgi:ABC-type transport system substrate-binding protein
MNIKVVDKKEFWEKIKSRSFSSIILGYNTDKIFWPYYYHSSQRNDPGLNITQFNSKKIDNLLIKLKNSNSKEEELKNAKELQDEINSYYIILNLEQEKTYYYLKKEIDNLNLNNVNSGIFRFKNINQWITKTEKVLPIFK